MPENINSNSVLIIAEAGVNHNGDIETAKKLIEAAREAGADYVKFQTFKTEELVDVTAPLADYQREQLSEPKSQFELLKQLELSKSDLILLKKYAEELGIKLFSTAFDLPSVDLLKEMNFGLWKIPSGEITHKPYLQKIAAYNEPTIVSTGMADLSEVKAALEVLFENGLDKNKVTVLHCNTEYPTPFSDVNLMAMVPMGQALNCPIGYSDHTLGIEVPIAAVALGARVIEKHFTLDRRMPGPDHQASLEPHELKQMVQGIRNIEKALGHATKTPSPSELKNKKIARKSLFAKKDIQAGEVFTAEHFMCKRPGNGISPMRIDELIGQKAHRSFYKNEMID